MATGQNKAKLRKILRSSLASTRAADELLDAVITLQNQYNALLAKIDSDTGTTGTDYEATLTVETITD